MVVLANKRLGDPERASPKDPWPRAFALLDRFVRNNIMAAEEADRLSLAFILEQSFSVLSVRGDFSAASSLQASSQLVTMLNWAMSPHVKRLNMAFVMIDEKLSDVSDRLTGNPHVATIEVPPADQQGAPPLHPGVDGRRGRSIRTLDFDARRQLCGVGPRASR